MRVWAEIDLGAFRENVRQVRARLAAGVRLLAIVKADAYGHGAAVMAFRAVEFGCHAVGVNDVGEATELRLSGLRSPVVILGGLLPDETGEAVRSRAELTVSRAEEVDALEREAERARVAVRIHLKFDTGMHRWGAAEAEAVDLARRIRASRRLKLAGVATHLACAARDDEAPTLGQIEVLRRVLEAMRAEGVVPETVHAANTAATLKFPALHFGMVRCGIGLYGIDPGIYEGAGYRPRPVMSLRAKVGLVRDVAAGATVGYDGWFRAERPMRVAVVAAGYYDGVPYRRTDAGEVLVRGRRARIVGRIMMDSFAADVTGIPEAAPGDAATLFGCDGAERLGVEEVARIAGTIPYEIPSRLGRRVRRVYRAAEEKPMARPWAAAL